MHSINRDEEKLGLLSSSDRTVINYGASIAHVTESDFVPRKEASIESNSLSSVIGCYLNGEHLLSLRWELIKQIGLIIVAFSGAGLYGVAADKYSLSNGYDSWAMRVSFIGSTCLTALVVLYNATDIFLSQQRLEQVPLRLVGILTQLRTVTQQRLRNVGITVAAAISALPLAMLTFTYPIPDIQLPTEIVLVIIVEIDNTILHFLPIELALQKKIYRIPFLPFEYSYKLISHCRLTLQERNSRQNEQIKHRIFSSIKQRLIGQLTLLQQRITIYGFSFDSCWFAYKNEITEASYFRDLEQDAYLYLESVLGFHCKPCSESRVKASNFRRGTCNQILRLIFYILGALWVISSCLGYIVSPAITINQILLNNTFVQDTGVSPMLVACLVTSPPLYFMGILLAFFGGNMMRDTYDYCVSWGYDDVKVPLQFKLYPKLSIAFMVFNVSLLRFCYAAAIQLIDDNFKESRLLDFIIWCAKSGLIFLSFCAMTDFYRKIIDKIVLYRTRGENNGVIRLSSTIDQLKAGIVLMTNKGFLESLSNLSTKQFKTFLGLHDAKDERELEVELRSLLPLYVEDDPLNQVTLQLLQKIVDI